MSDTPIEDSIKALHYERTRKKEPPPWWPAVEAILNEHGLQAIDFVADFKAAMKQGEPVAKYIGETPYGGSEVQLYEDLKKGTERTRSDEDGEYTNRKQRRWRGVRVD